MTGPFRRAAPSTVSPTSNTVLPLVLRRHDVGADAGDERFPNRTKAAVRAPAPMRTARAIPTVRRGAKRPDRRHIPDDT